MTLPVCRSKQFSACAYPPRRNSNLSHLYFKIENQTAFLAHLKHFNLVPLAVDEVVVTVEDPDGRKVMFGIA